MAVKVTKGQICDGSISKKLCHKEYNIYYYYYLLIGTRKTKSYKNQCQIHLNKIKPAVISTLGADTISWGKVFQSLTILCEKL